jgi:hypothetical protein
MANMSGRPGVPRSRSDSCSFGQDVVAATRDLPETIDPWLQLGPFRCRTLSQQGSRIEP